MKPLKQDCSNINYYLVFAYRLLIAMFLLFICRFLFYFFNASLFPNISDTEWLKILKGGFVFDTAGLLYMNMLFIAISLLPFPKTTRCSQVFQKTTRYIFFICNGIAILLNTIDFAYFRFTLRRTTASVFQEFSHEENRTKLGLEFLVDYWYVVLVFAALLLLMVWLYNRISLSVTGLKTKSNWKYYLKSTVIFLAVIPFIVAGIRGGFKHSTRPITISSAGQYVQNPNEIYLVLNTPFCFVRTFNEKPFTKVKFYSDEAVEKIFSPVHRPANNGKPFTKKNVVIIILESFGKEAVGFYNKDLDSGTYKGFTPFLDSLAGVSKIYWNSFANGRKSIDALPSIITSIPSEKAPFVLTPYVSDTIKSLAHILKEEGYHASFFHGAPNGSMGFLAFMKMMGIEKYYGKDEYKNIDDYDGIWGIWDEPFMQFFGQKLNSFQQPFFSTIFTVSSHHPFKVPEKYEGYFPKGPLPVLECIAYSDMALQKFFNEASKQNWFNNTLFVISADHATVSYHPEYQSAWGDVAVPILLYAPGDTAFRGVEQDIIQQIDLMPTVLGYLNYNKPFVAFGDNVLNRRYPSYAFKYSGNFHWFQGDYLIFFDGKKTTALYNYTQDKALKNDLLPLYPQIAADMERRLKAFIQQYNNRIIDNRLTAK